MLTLLTLCYNLNDYKPRKQMNPFNIKLNNNIMKKLLFLVFLTTAIFSCGFAQVPASFNYQAVVRNSSGEIIANKTVSFRISLLRDSESGSVIYSETHTVTTNNFGLVNLKIGEGTKLSGTFSPADWGDVIFTKVEIDPAGGSSYSHLATTQLSSVPYAFKAQTVVNDKVDDADADATNEIQLLSLSGNALSISEGNTVTLPTAGNTSGWTVAGSVVKLSTNTDKVGIGTATPSAALHVIGNDGVLFEGTLDSGTIPKEGRGTRIMWYPKKAAFRAGYVDGTEWDDANIGDISTAMGQATIASGAASTAMGFSTTASGRVSTAMGDGTTASGDYSTAMGDNTTASSVYSTAMGKGSKASGEYSTAMGGYTKASGNNSTATGYYTEASSFASTAMGDETTASGIYSTAMGGSTAASGGGSTTMGSGTTASGDASTAMGSDTEASSFASTAMGDGTIASGGYSTAMGQATIASNYQSVAMGWESVASGWRSTAMGERTHANSYNSLAIGQYNVGGGTAGSWVLTDPLFEIGNGLDDAHRANAVTVLKDGNIGIGTANPTSKLEVDGIIHSTVSGFKFPDGTIQTTAAAGNTSGWTVAGSVVKLSTNTDKVGIGTETPSATLHVKGDDGVLFQGTNNSGTALNLGAGTRMMWYPKKAAFRAGHVDVTQWDDANIGEFSTAMGYSTTASGATSTAIGSGTTASGSNSTAMGNGTTSSGDYSTAMGYGSTATGEYSTAMGCLTLASGDKATAMGQRTKATGEYSTAMGQATEASSYQSVAMGWESVASGWRATAMGERTHANSYNSLAIGQYNVGGGTAGSWVLTDPLFEIGNGRDDAHRANAVTVYKNGNTHISGTITSGTANVSLPIAYGVINTGGSVNNATNNVSCTWVTDHYEISISGESYSQTAYVCSVEALGITPVMTTTGATGGKLQVYIYNTLGTKIKDAFHFVIYKL